MECDTAWRGYFLLPCIRRELPVSGPVGITRKSLLYKDFQIGVYLIIKKYLTWSQLQGLSYKQRGDQNEEITNRLLFMVKRKYGKNCTNATERSWR